MTAPTTTPWVPPADVLAAINALHVHETQGSMTGDGRPTQLSPHTGVVAFAAAMKAKFPFVTSTGIRAGDQHHGLSTATGRRDMHEEARAIDFMLPGPESARVVQGPLLANWLSRNAQAFGIQGIVSRSGNWFASYPAGRRFRPYPGSSPHVDHVHVELSEEAANRGSLQMAQLVANTPLEPGSTAATWGWYAGGAVILAGVAAWIVTRREG